MIKRPNIRRIPSAASCRLALILLCPLAIAGCDTPHALKPPVFDMACLNQDGSTNDCKDYARQPWACVLDNKSGLIWEIKQPEPGLHGIDNTYTWYDPNPVSHGGFAGKSNGGTCTGSECDTLSFVKAVNAEELCGFSDWHMPSRYEMGTIVNEGVFYPGPTLPKGYFPESKPGKYWTDTTFKTRRAAAWAWAFDYGSEFATEKTDALNVRLIHIAKKPAAPTAAK